LRSAFLAPRKGSLRIEPPTQGDYNARFSGAINAAMNDEFQQRARELIDAGRFIHGRGWAPATSGNFSARLSDGRIAITVSGRHKGELVLGDIMLIDAEGRSLDGKKPSAETLLHTSIYRRYPTVGAVLHPHGPSATLVSRLFRDALVLKDYELLKALAGIDTHETRVTIPIFPNDQNIPRLALQVEDYLDRHGDIYGYIIAGHGFYTWGATVKDALRHVEALEFLFDLEIRLHGVKIP
jgi:methylthioribulose-1-phosphate dehydratase